MEEDGLATLEIPENVRQVLADFVRRAREVFGVDLKSAVLYGSAAAGQMRPTSDVNLLLVLRRMDFGAAEQVAETLGRAEAAIGLKVMFLLENEVVDAATAFALKFADISDRHVLLFGDDPFAALAVSRDAKIFRLNQVLLNLILRQREGFIRSGGADPRRLRMIADFAGPLRAAAVTLLELENSPPAATPKEALERVAGEIDAAKFGDAVRALTAARSEQVLPAGTPGNVLQSLIELATRMRERAARLGAAPEFIRMVPAR